MQFPDPRSQRLGHASFTPFSSGGDVQAQLFQDRIITLGELDNASAELLIANLLLLERNNPAEEVSLYINSTGGPIEAALAIYDIINLVSCPVATVCTGTARGGAALLVAAGAPGRRAALPNSRFMLRAPRSEFEGTAADAEGIAAESTRLHQSVSGLFCRHTCLTPAEVEGALSKSRYMGAPDALRAGIVDALIERPPRAWREIFK